LTQPKYSKETNETLEKANHKPHKPMILALYYFVIFIALFNAVLILKMVLTYKARIKIFSLDAQEFGFRFNQGSYETYEKLKSETHWRRAVLPTAHKMILNPLRWTYSDWCMWVKKQTGRNPILCK
jgi:hypothetical protein